ncbi:transporter substrate-binding domain-containing protein [Merdimmobilis hominis]|uniref:Arginine-binding extracellular protein ArtP n=1 Tax=uncultured Anaerotruncus sp. TaxID=905011 RepID=A0A6N2QWL2_9FIRM|nr:transporter substrate-binding domain-containing protein [Merdimmobilis hominis]MCD4836892.1 transporter substrate-binding domain-containing protein [Merdimmobilis hominis]
MKKLLALILATLTMTSVLAGCSNGEGNSSSTPSEGSSQSSSGGVDRLEKIKSSGKLVFVTSPDYAPYEFIDLEKMGQGDEQYVGSDIELAKYIADSLGVELVIQPMDFDSVLAAVSEGKCDIAISGIASKPERAEKMDFSIPYKKTSQQGIMILKENAEKFQSVEDLNKPEVKVGAQNGSIQMEGAKEKMPDANIVPIAKLGDGVMQLQAGKIDALVIANITGDGYCETYDNLMMADIPWELKNDGSAVAIPKGNPELVAEINRIIEETQEKDLYEQWLADAQELALSQQQDQK